MEISKIEVKDIDEIYDIGISIKDFSADGGKNCFWPKETLNNIITSEQDIGLKIKIADKIVGFCLVMIHSSTKKAYLENFYVDNLQNCIYK